MEIRKKFCHVIDPPDQPDVLLEIKLGNQPFNAASMFTTARFVLSGNHKLNVTALPANYGSGANEIFLSFDRRQMADHAHAQFLVWLFVIVEAVFLSPGESIQVDAVMNQHNLVLTKDALGAKYVGDGLRNGDHAIRAAQRQLVRSV